MSGQYSDQEIPGVDIATDTLTALDLEALVGDAGDGAATEAVTSIPKTSLDELPQNVQDDFQSYENNDWQGNYKGQDSGYNAGKIYRNATAPRLPEKIDGETPEYHEYDTGDLKENGNRSSARFVRDAKSGKTFYTDSHYKGQWEEVDK